MDGSAGYGKETLLQHLAEGEKLKGAVVQPIFQNSLFLFDTQAQFSDAFKRHHETPSLYSRVGNPTVEIAEQKVAMLEGTDRCKLFGSGMAAITSAVMSCLKEGSHVVAVDTCYGPVKDLLIGYLTKWGVTTTFVDGVSKDEVLDAIKPETALVYLESPSSLVFRLQELEPIAKACREKGVSTIIDNTYATPLYQTPYAFGIDLVVHSVTKYLGGHSDIVAGAVCGSKERIDRLVNAEVALFGSILSPFPAWLLTRSLRSLAIRMERHRTAGNTVAGWLEAQPWVERVHHLGLESYPQKDLFRRQMTGSTGLFSFEPKDQSEEKVVAFIEALNLFGLGVSWGGFESLSVQLQVKALYMESPRRVVRLSIGFEEPRDLIEDLRQAGEIAFSA